MLHFHANLTPMSSRAIQNIKSGMVLGSWSINRWLHQVSIYYPTEHPRLARSACRAGEANQTLGKNGGNQLCSVSRRNLAPWYFWQAANEDTVTKVLAKFQFESSSRRLMSVCHQDLVVASLALAILYPAVPPSWQAGWTKWMFQSVRPQAGVALVSLASIPGTPQDTINWIFHTCHLPAALWGCRCRWCSAPAQSRWWDTGRPALKLWTSSQLLPTEGKGVRMQPFIISDFW